MQLSLIVLLLFALGLTPSSVASVTKAAETPLSVQHVPGAEIAVTGNGKLAIDSVYGVKDLKTQAPVDAQTHFEIASLTKAFTAAAILQLTEEGKLRLSDTLDQYVPEYAPGKSVTLEQMLWHVSGIPEYILVKGYPEFWKTARSTPGSLAAVVSFLGNAPLNFTPGSQYEYSNSNYALLALVVERASHMSWEAYLRKNIFARAGMTQTAFIEDERALPDMAAGYKADPKGNLAPAPWAGHWFDGAGSIVSTAADVAKWDEAFFSGRIVDSDDVQLATRPHILPSGKSTGEGFGWRIDTFGGQPRYEYTGKSWGFTAMNEYFPQLKQAVIVLTNDDGEQVSAVGNAVVGALHPRILQAYLTPAKGEDPAVTARVDQWVHRLQTGDIDASQLEAKVPADEIAADEHAFHNRGNLTAAVFRKKVANAGGTVYLYLLQFQGGVITMAMSIDRDGKIADMSLLQGDGRA